MGKIKQQQNKQTNKIQQRKCNVLQHTEGKQNKTNAMEEQELGLRLGIFLRESFRQVLKIILVSTKGC